MNKIICLFGITLTSFICKSQDIILKKDGTEIKCKVVEIVSSIIKYKAYDNLNGPIYSTDKSNVFMITYENGTKEVLNPKTPEAQKETAYQNPELTRKGFKVYEDGEKLSPDNVKSILAISPYALDSYSKGRNLRGVGLVVSWAAVGVMFYNSYQNIDTQIPTKPALLYGTYGVWGVGILMQFAGFQKIKSSIYLYNSEREKVSYNISPSFNNNGIGIVMKF